MEEKSIKEKNLKEKNLKEKNLTFKNLLNFLNESPTAFHAVINTAEFLEKAEFSELYENQEWNLEKGGKYYLRRNNSSIIAFEVGTNLLNGFRIIGTHTDSPNFKLKPNNVIITSDGYVKLNTECYGGVILSTWFDRPLSLAGRIIIKNKDNGIKAEYINIKKPILIIPSLCIHLNKDVNNGYSFNKQTDMLPFLGFECKDIKKDAEKNYILNIISEETNISKEDIIDYDLFLYENEKGQIMGAKDEFISASRLDNLWMTFTGMQAIINSDKSESTKVFVAFDNEEIGSTTRNGANSSFLNSILQRICIASGLTVEKAQIAISNSMAVSADCAHAVHPNYSDKHDQTNRPLLGKGMAIKYSTAQKYATNAYTAGILEEICQKADIPYQKYVNRSDVLGGSTIGPAMSSLTSIPTVDIGIPILAMHSIREFGCLYDNKSTIDALLKFLLLPQIPRF